MADGSRNGLIRLLAAALPTVEKEIPMSARHTKVLIIGSGPAGYTAAVYAARAMLKPVLIAGMEQGGQLMITTDVENYPGFADPIQGPWLMDQMLQQAKHVGAEIVNDIVTEVEMNQRPFVARTDSGQVWTADTLIIATGAKAKWLGIESEQHFQGFGVSACATCDGFFYRNKDVIVVGGGNSAVEEALYLSNIAKSVTVVHRRDSFRAEKILQERLFSKENIKVLWNTEVAEITGTPAKPPMPPSVTGARLRDTRTGAITDVAVDGVFVAIGHAPATELFKGKLKLKDNGYLWTAPDSTATSLEGVYAAGDVTDDTFRQAVTAAGHGLHGSPRSRTISDGPHARRRGRGVRSAMRGGGMPLDWDKLRIFHAAAEAGSFTHAADKLHLSQSAISRQVSALEQDVGTKLFHRHARGLILTGTGRTALSHRPRRAAEARNGEDAADRDDGNADRQAARHHDRRPRPGLAHRQDPGVHAALSRMCRSSSSSTTRKWT